MIRELVRLFFKLDLEIFKKHDINTETIKTGKIVIQFSFSLVKTVMKN
jgi:hypothetical protein